MANKDYDKEDGVWRTIGGRRVFIRNGQSLADAMKESGKFKNKNASQITLTHEEYLQSLKDDATTKTELDEIDKELKKDKKERTTRDVQNEYDALSKKMQQDDYYYKAEDDRKLKELRAEYDTKVAKGEKDVNRDDYNKKNEIKDTRATIKSIAEKSKENNVTLDTETGEAVKFDKGYSVSFQQSTDNYSDKEFDEKVNECKNICNGKLYAGKYGGDAEPSFYTEDLSSAKEIMYKYNQESIYDWETDDYIYNEKYDASKNKTNFNANEQFEETKDAQNYRKELANIRKQLNDGDIDLEEAGAKREKLERENKFGKMEADYNDQLKARTTNETMNEKIRAKATKKSPFKEDLPKHTEIKEQGTSNRKEVSENIQAHILEYYDNPQDFVEQMEYMNEPTMWRAGEKLAEGGSYAIYYDDQREFLNSLKINPKGKEFSDDRVFDTYKSLIGRESAKLYDRLKKNAFNKYKQEHPLTRMTFEEFKNMKK